MRSPGSGVADAVGRHTRGVGRGGGHAVHGRCERSCHPTAAAATAAWIPCGLWRVPRRRWLWLASSRGPRDQPGETRAVRVIANAMTGYVDRLGPIWVEGQIAQLTRRPSTATVFMTLRDPLAEVSVQVTCHRSVLDAMPAPVTEGARVVVHAKFQLLRAARLAVPRGQGDPPGRCRRAAGPDRAAPPAAGRRGAVRPGPQAPAAVPPGADRSHRRPRLRRRARRDRQRPPTMARRDRSASSTPSSRATTPPAR